MSILREVFSSFIAFEQLESHLNPTDCALLYNLLHRDRERDENALKTIVEFAIVKGDESRERWLAELAANRQVALGGTMSLRKRLWAKLRGIYEGLVSRLKH